MSEQLIEFSYRTHKESDDVDKDKGTFRTAHINHDDQDGYFKINEAKDKDKGYELPNFNALREIDTYIVINGKLTNLGKFIEENRVKRGDFFVGDGHWLTDYSEEACFSNGIAVIIDFTGKTKVYLPPFYIKSEQKELYEKKKQATPRETLPWYSFDDIGMWWVGLTETERTDDVLNRLLNGELNNRLPEKVVNEFDTYTYGKKWAFVESGDPYPREPHLLEKNDGDGDDDSVIRLKQYFEKHNSKYTTRLKEKTEDKKRVEKIEKKNALTLFQETNGRYYKIEFEKEYIMELFETLIEGQFTTFRVHPHIPSKLMKYGTCSKIESNKVTFSSGLTFFLNSDYKLERPFYIFEKQKTKFNEMYSEAKRKKREKDIAKAMAGEIVPKIISKGEENFKAVATSDGGKRKSRRNKKVTRSRKINSRKVKKMTRKSRKY